MLATKFSHPRDAFISFCAANHQYVYKSKLVFPQSVSSVASRFFRSHFDAEKVASSNLEKWQDLRSKYYKFISSAKREIDNINDEKIVKGISEAWRLNGAHKSLLGTEMHAEIEALLNDEKRHMSKSPPIIGSDGNWATMCPGVFEQLCSESGPFALPENLAKRVCEILHGADTAEDAVVVSMHTVAPEIESWKAWKASNFDLTPVRTEWSIYSTEYKLAGQLDALFISKASKAFVLVDWKRVSDLSPVAKFPWEKRRGSPPFENVEDTKFGHYTIQLNVYAFLLDKYYGVKVSEMRLVQIHPSLPSPGYAELKVPFLESTAIESALTSLALKQKWRSFQNS